MTLSVRTDSMGIIGSSVKYLLLGFFSSLSILISFTLIFLGVYKLIYGDKFSYQNISKKMIGLLTFICFLIYGLLNIDFLPKASPLSLENTRLIFSQSQRGQGSGIISTSLTYYMKRLLGSTGSWFFAIVLSVFFAVFYLKVDIKNLGPKARSAQNWLTGLIKDIVSKIQNFVLVDEEEEDEKTVKKKRIKIKKEDDFEETQNIFSEKNDTENDFIIPDFQNKKENLISTNNENIVSNNKKYKGTASELYVFPPVDILRDYPQTNKKDISNRAKNTKTLENTLLNFGVDAKVKNVTYGPTIIRYELEPKAGTKVSKITNLTEDLALALAAHSIRIEAPIPGKSLIGIEVPTSESEMVSFKDIVSSLEFKKTSANIAFGMGKDITGSSVISDISKMPHVLIAGATGSGKSVCVNTLICSILYKYTPAEVQLIMIDPKMVELSIYNGIGHLLIPVVTDMKKAPNALNWAVGEMNRRYKLFSEHKVKDINGYNEKFEEKLTRIVIIVDELADLMMVSPNEVEDAICRLAQMARACGIHLVIATQRPSVDVITGLIKANIPSRIAFAVSSQMDSRTILDSGGAEKLLGRGDMLYYPMGASKPVRMQGAFVTEQEVEMITDFIKENNGEKEEDKEISMEIEKIEFESENIEDALIPEVLEFIKEREQASTSMLQRKFRIGYNRASRIIDDLEDKGIIGPSDGSKPRKVFLDKIIIPQEKV